MREQCARFSQGPDMAALVAVHDWASTPLGDRRHWPKRLEAVVDTCLALPMAAAVWWGPDLITLYNDAAVATLGAKHPRGLGRPAADVWPEAWSVIAPRVEKVLRTERPVVEENLRFTLERGRGPEEAYFSVAYSPLHDFDHRVAGILVTATETTAKVLADRQRAADVERTRRLFEKAPGFIAILRGPDHVFEFANETYRRLAGRREFIGRSMREVFPEIADQPFFALLDQVYTTGERFVAYGAPVRLDHAGFRIDYVYEPIKDESGAVTGIFVEGHNVTDRVRAELALQDSEQRFRAVANLVPDMLWCNDANGQLNWFNQRWYDYTGMTLKASAGNGWLDAIHPDDLALGLETYQQAIEAATPAEHQHRIRRHDGTYRWHLARMEPVQGDDGKITAWFGTITDIDELKRLQQHEHLLLTELQHRVRNTLAVVRSLVRRTSEHGTSIADYVRDLDGRLSAFARTQAYVTRDPLHGVSLAAILHDELTAHAARKGEQVAIGGPELRLQPIAADRIGLAIHELATNALKYGALAADGGQIRVAWRVVDGQDGPSLLFDWIEAVPGGIGQPSTQGFGTELLTQGLPYELGATTALAHTATGIQFHLEVQMSRLTMPEIRTG